MPLFQCVSLATLPLMLVLVMMLTPSELSATRLTLETVKLWCRKLLYFSALTTILLQPEQRQRMGHWLLIQHVYTKIQIKSLYNYDIVKARLSGILQVYHITEHLQNILRFFARFASSTYVCLVTAGQSGCSNSIRDDIRQVAHI